MAESVGGLYGSYFGYEGRAGWSFRPPPSPQTALGGGMRVHAFVVISGSFPLTEIQNCSQFYDLLFLKVYESESLSCILRNVHQIHENQYIVLGVDFGPHINDTII